MDTKSIMIVGVGGQGTLLASKLIGRILMEKGYDVKVSEVHGMSQRGGSVVTYVRYGDKVYSPVIDPGQADYVLSFEPLEAARAVPFLKKGGTVITNSARTNPMPVITGAAEYPAEIINNLKESGIKVISLDAMKLAVEAGSSKAVNLVLLGVLSKITGWKRDEWITAIRESVPEKFYDMNIKAFDSGANASES